VSKGIAQEVRQIVERVAHELLEVVVVERVELHEFAFVRVDHEPFAGEQLGVADDLLEVRLRLGIPPPREPHRYEGNAAHQRGGHDHSERDVLQCPHDADRAESLADD